MTSPDVEHEVRLALRRQGYRQAEQPEGLWPPLLTALMVVAALFVLVHVLAAYFPVQA